MRLPLPRTLTGQLLGILIIVLLITQALNFVALVGERRLLSRQAQADTAMAQFVAEAVRLQPEQSTPASQLRLPQVVLQGGRDIGMIFLAASSRVTSLNIQDRDKALEKNLLTRLQDAGVSVRRVMVARRELRELPRRTAPPPRDQMFHPRQPPPTAPGMEEITLSAELAPGLWLNGAKPYYATEAVSMRIGLITLAIALFGSLLVWLFARRITQPLRQLASAADHLGRGQTTSPVSEAGPQDIRVTARAFNQMQDRMSRLLETQRTMLRAVGHDLRTPLTSLRLRAESIDDEHTRVQMISTLEDMNVMTEEILRWAKDASSSEEISRIDLNAMLQSIADDYADRGEEVSCQQSDNDVILECRRVALRRCLGNLIDNALKYGHRARISTIHSRDEVKIFVDDGGPGVPEDMLEAICNPFVRLENSRSRSTGGVGLGLAIAKSVVESHGGVFKLYNLPKGGLRAEISIPLI